jgi:hypothetical protein
MDEPRRRSVVHEHAFEHALRALIEDAWGADEFIEAAQFTLAADPLIGVEVMRGVWVLPMAPIEGREIALYYTFDEQTVWFLSIGPSEGEAEEER